ncbi:MAG: ABC transporter ATP-binding protein [Candidatus Babeliales bacterium]
MPIKQINIKNITKQFMRHDGKMVSVIDDISLSLEKNNTYAFMGVSGSGKSTLLHIIACFDQPTTGIVYFNNMPYNQLPSSAQQHIRTSSLGFVFQSPYLIDELTIIENVMLKGLIGRMEKKECTERAHSLLELVGLLKEKDQFPYTLSGGQQQRVALARALISQPDFLFADEPTGNLDQSTALDIITLLITLHRTYKMGLVINTHDSTIAHYINTVFLLHKGKITQENLKNSMREKEI